MKKRPYEKPALQVFELKQQSALLAGSENVNALMNGTFTEEDWNTTP